MGYRRSLFGAAGAAALLTNGPAGAAGAPSVTVFDGFVSVTETIALKTALPSGSTVYCQIDLNANDAKGTHAVAHKVIAATRGSSASVYSCTVLTPYRWNFAGSTGTFSGRYTAFVGDISTQVNWGSSSASIASFAIPPDGTTTKFNEALWL